MYARECVHVYKISYTHEKYLTITAEDGSAMAVLDKRAGNFLLLQKTFVNSSDKNCENLN
jgi:fructose-1,6-bisphosphatase